MGNFAVFWGDCRVGDPLDSSRQMSCRGGDPLTAIFLALYAQETVLAQDERLALIGAMDLLHTVHYRTGASEVKIPTPTKSA